MKTTAPSILIFKQLLVGCLGVANLVGMFVFLRWSASCCWIEPELKDMPGASGGTALVWFFGPLPILAGFVLADLAWAIVAETRAPSERRLRVLAVPILMVVGWVAVFVFDGVHHGS